jgi:hypothetical protein
MLFVSFIVAFSLLVGAVITLMVAISLFGNG